MQIFLRKYATSATIDVDLLDPTGTSFLTSAAISPNACIISQDGGTSAFSTNPVVVRSNGFSIDFTAAELTCKRLKYKIVDTATTKTWLDLGQVCETYGTSASMHGDLASGLLQNVVDTISIQQLFTEFLAVLTGNIVQNGNNFSHMSRDNSTSVVNLSAAGSSRVRN